MASLGRRLSSRSTRSPVMRSLVLVSMRNTGSLPMESLRISMQRSTAESLRAKLSPVSVPSAGYPADTRLSTVTALRTEGDRATARMPWAILIRHHRLPGS